MRTLRTLIVALLLGSATIASASAEDGFAYWSYWQGDSGAWTYANLGPASIPVKDGAVDGWRFGVSGGSMRTAVPPATAPDFDIACQGVESVPGSARVAIVIDPGDGNAYTRCAVVAAGLSRASALSSVAPLRTDNGFICAIDGAPATGCAEDRVPLPASSTAAAAPATRLSSTHTPATTPAPEPTTTPAAQADAVGPADPAPAEADGSPWPTAITIVLALGALVLAQRSARRQLEQR